MKNTTGIEKIVALLAGLTVVFSGVVSMSSSAAQTSKPPPSVSTGPPEGAPDVKAQWLRIDPGDGTSQLVAVVRPPKAMGKGPFPAVISLHGGSGFGPGLVEQAPRLARAGFVVVTGCWLANPPDAPPPHWCTNAPDPPHALANLEAVAREQPGVRKNSIGVVGFSSGAGPVFNYEWGPWVKALAVDSGLGVGATGEFVTKAAAPVLLLIGTANETFPVSAMRDFESTLTENGVTVESKYYAGGTHVVTINGPGDIADAANARLARFLKKRLR